MEYNIIFLTYLILSFCLGYILISFLEYKKELEKDSIEIVFEKEEIKESKKIQENYDIVYVLTNGIADKPSELTYSLRSLQNFPYRKVWFCGGQPKNLVPDGRIQIKQIGITPYEKVYNSLKAVCENDKVTDNFYLFNDDFFILHKMNGFEPMRNYSIHKLILDYDISPKGNTDYVKALKATLELMRDKRLTYWNYETHTPILLNKEKLRVLFKEFPNLPLFRSIYGNYFEIGGFNHEDCKIGWDMNLIPHDDWPIVSTSERSFANGAVGEFIRKKFPEKSRFEID